MKITQRGLMGYGVSHEWRAEWNILVEPLSNEEIERMQSLMAANRKKWLAVTLIILGVFGLCLWVL